MTCTVNLHHLKSVEALHHATKSWVLFKAEGDSEVVVFMPQAAADMIAEAWKSHRDFVAPMVLVQDSPHSAEWTPGKAVM